MEKFDENLKNKKKEEKLRRMRTRQDFLLTLLDPEEKYQVKKMNGFVLVKQWNGGSNCWDVAIYRPETWAKVEEWKKNQSSLFDKIEDGVYND